MSQKQIDKFKEAVYLPLEHYKTYRNEIVAGDATLTTSIQKGLDRLQRGWMNIVAERQLIT